MRDLTITVMQANLKWEDAAANRELFSERIASLKVRPDLRSEERRVGKECS